MAQSMELEGRSVEGEGCANRLGSLCVVLGKGLEEQGPGVSRQQERKHTGLYFC
jgi:hypothetical protein